MQRPKYTWFQFFCQMAIKLTISPAPVCSFLLNGIVSFVGQMWQHFPLCYIDSCPRTCPIHLCVYVGEFFCSSLRMCCLPQQNFFFLLYTNTSPADNQPQPERRIDCKNSMTTTLKSSPLEESATIWECCSIKRKWKVFAVLPCDIFIYI